MSSAFLPSRVDLVLKEEEIGLSSYGGNGVQEGALWALRTSGGPCVLPDCPKCSTGNQVWHSSRRKRSSDAFTVNAPCKEKHSVLIHPHWHMSDWYPFLPRKQVFTSHKKRLWGLWMPEKGQGREMAQKGEARAPKTHMAPFTWQPCQELDLNTENTINQPWSDALKITLRGEMAGVGQRGLNFKRETYIPILALHSRLGKTGQAASPVSSSVKQEVDPRFLTFQIAAMSAVNTSFLLPAAPWHLVQSLGLGGIQWILVEGMDE